MIKPARRQAGTAISQRAFLLPECPRVYSRVGVVRERVLPEIQLQVLLVLMTMVLAMVFENDSRDDDDRDDHDDDNDHHHHDQVKTMMMIVITMMTMMIVTCCTTLRGLTGWRQVGGDLKMK